MRIYILLKDIVEFSLPAFAVPFEEINDFMIQRDADTLFDWVHSEKRVFGERRIVWVRQRRTGDLFVGQSINLCPVCC